MNETIANILNSIPEPLATAILTATFTGVIVFLLQKRIERSFAQSLHEYQIKFSRTYPKTMDVLEEFIQKYNDFSGAYSALISMVLMSIWTKDSAREQAPLVKEETDAVLKQINKDILDCYTYFRINRYYLPDETVKELDETTEKMKSLKQYLSYYLDMPDVDIRVFRELVKLLMKSDGTGVPDKKALEELLSIPYGDFIRCYIQLLDNSAKDLSERLENHYRKISAMK